MSKPIELVIAQLEIKGYDPKPSGPGNWRSRCPAHEGKSHNLSITETPEGTVLIHCHHCDNSGAETCSPPMIAGRLGLTMKDLYPLTDKRGLPAKRPAKKNRHVPPKGQGKPTAEAAIAFVAKQLGEPTNSWTYYEAHNGQRFPLMAVYRFDLADGSKQFRPVNVSEDGWRLGDPPGKLPLYNLPEITAAETVVVVEGEKCCEIVRQLGLPATTSSHGSKSAAKTDWSLLAGKTVVIIPDNDEPGESYSLAVAFILSTLNPKPTIKILRLPLSEKGHDIEEWLKGSIPEQWSLVDARIELERMWSRLPEWTRPKETANDAGDESEEESLFSLTEWGNAKRMVKQFGGKMRYCYPNSKWMIWDGHRWTDDERGEIWRIAKSTVRNIPQEAIEAEDSQYRQEILRWAARSEGARQIKSAIELAWSEPGIGAMPDDFDTDPYLLNCPNGVVDLITGTIRPQKPEDLLSKSTAVNYDPMHPCPRWIAALNTIFDNDQTLIDYLQRACGYSLTGDIGEHAMFFCYGTGRNGKNTVLDTIRDVLGKPGSSYAAVTDPKIFLAAGQNEHPAAIAALVGKRMVVTSEIDINQQFAQGLVKRLTGERTMKTRFMRGNWFEFNVQFKIWMQANAKPDISGTDEGIWSRIRIIPFDVFIPVDKRVKGLSEILVREEGPGILAWLVEGCKKWKETGLAEPDKVKNATDKYRSEQDIIGMFLEQCTKSWLDYKDVGPMPRVHASKLYARYKEWCDASGEPDPLTARKFGSEITARGYKLTGSNGHQARMGITLCENGETT